MKFRMAGISEENKPVAYIEIAIILFFWILLFASPLLFSKQDNGIDWNHVFKIWKEHAFLLVLFLINRFILVPYLFFRHKRLRYIIAVVCLISVSITGAYFYYKKPAQQERSKPPAEARQQERRPENRPENQPGPPRPESRNENRQPPRTNQPEPIPPYVNLLMLSFLVFGFDTGLKITSRYLNSEKHRLNLEKENVETQLAFLRNQVSPHFFMNTLNNIHSLIDINTTEAKDSIIKLSTLMRHLLYESDYERCPIKNEVDFIKSYVDLMKLRCSEKVKISLIVPDILPDKSIPPLLFTSLLENAFKHGISYIEESFIEIELTVFPDKLYFKTRNTRNLEKSGIPGKGIGIANTRKRLDLLYKDRYTLDISDNGNIFITNLSIPI